MSGFEYGTPPSTGGDVDLSGLAHLSGSNNFDTTPTVNGNTVVVVGGDGKIDSAAMPAIAITSVASVGSQAAMLALNAQEGDVAVRTDINKSFILAASPASTLANWVELRSPTDAVSSVDGRTGVVTLGDLYQSIAASVASAAVSRSITDSDDVVNATTSGVVLTLHNATTARVKRYTLHNGSNGNISFATTASQTVNGSTTGTIIPNQSLDVVPSNGNWIIV